MKVHPSKTKQPLFFISLHWNLSSVKHCVVKNMILLHRHYKSCYRNTHSSKKEKPIHYEMIDLRARHISLFNYRLARSPFTVNPFLQSKYTKDYMMANPFSLKLNTLYNKHPISATLFKNAIKKKERKNLKSLQNCFTI